MIVIRCYCSLSRNTPRGWEIEEIQHILERETLTRTLRKRCRLASAAAAGRHLKRD